LSHRFIRFEIPDKQLDLGREKVEEYIRFVYLEEPYTVYHKL
jgi:hypothetical protein